ncbi:hypothetical protein VL03_15505 [Rossellomorea marisflavi]|nr:hypothetical protein VL03_15505 [Rossellomorea marisflavi]KML32100.1 hypothetical protein VL12_16585 [Rossellomorea marisflavi]
MGLFRSAAAVRIPRGVVRASSCLWDLSRTLFPSESAGLRCTALFGEDGVSDSIRRLPFFFESGMEGEERWVCSVPLRPSAFRGEWVELPRACGISPALYSLRSRSASAALHFLVKMG